MNIKWHIGTFLRGVPWMVLLSFLVAATITFPELLFLFAFIVAAWGLGIMVRVKEEDEKD